MSLKEGCKGAMESGPGFATHCGCGILGLEHFLQASRFMLLISTYVMSCV